MAGALVRPKPCCQIMTANNTTRGEPIKTPAPTQAQTVFNAKQTLRGHYDDTTVAQAVMGR